MATLLIATTSGGVVERIDLDPQRAYSLGRSLRCEIPLAPKSISRRHAVLFPHATGWWVADAGSSRGLSTATGPTRFAQLTLDGWISLGPLVLWLVPGRQGAKAPTVGLNHLGDEAAVATPAGPSLALANGSDEDDAGDGSERSDGGTTSHPTLFEWQTADGQSRFLDLSQLPFATIGSDVACTLRGSCDALAPLHAVLIREPHHWAVVAAQGMIDAEGSRFRRKRLEPGAFVALGGMRMRTVAVERMVALPAAECDAHATPQRPAADSSAFRRSESAA